MNTASQHNSSFINSYQSKSQNEYFSVINPATNKKPTSSIFQHRRSQETQSVPETDNIFISSTDIIPQTNSYSQQIRTLRDIKLGRKNNNYSRHGVNDSRVMN